MLTLAFTFWSQPQVVTDSWVELATVITLIAFVIGAYRKINCHEPGCWRISKHHVEGTPYVTCHRHHPGLAGDSVQRGHIKAAHDRLASVSSVTVIPRTSTKERK
jgi:hypothetical protein